MKRVLVTGASGFIGRHCLPLLVAKGYDVHAVARQPIPLSDRVQWHQVDLLDKASLDRLTTSVGATHLLHLAWYAEHGKYWSSSENLRWVRSGLELFEAFARHGGRRITVAGTCAEYDWRYGCCSEEVTPLVPHSLYGACKHALQMILSRLAPEVDLSAAWARIFLLYGPFEHPDRLVASVTRSLLDGRPVKYLSTGRIRDLLFVEDVASALVAILDSDATGPVNIGSGHPLLLDDVVREIAHQVGPPDLVVPMTDRGSGRADEPLILIPDTTRLRRDLRWTPQYSLRTGLSRTVQWWRDQSSTQPAPP